MEKKPQQHSNWLEHECIFPRIPTHDALEAYVISDFRRKKKTKEKERRCCRMCLGSFYEINTFDWRWVFNDFF